VFVGYAVSAFAYRILVIFGIAFLLLDKFFYVGMVLVVTLVGSWLILPFWKTSSFLLTSPRLRRVRAAPSW